MGATYKATGINLKSVPMGESDRLLTILTREFGVVRAIAPGSRKHKSTLRGRSDLFMLNDLLIVKGRSLDKVIQAESIESFPSLGRELGKLTASQYLAELVLCQALTDQPQPELFALLWEHLSRLNQRPLSLTLASLVQAVYHLLAYGGLTPQVFHCCLTQYQIVPDVVNPQWSVQFDAASGGIIATHLTKSQGLGSQSSGSQRSSLWQSTSSASDSLDLNVQENINAQENISAQEIRPKPRPILRERRSPYSTSSSSPNKIFEQAPAASALAKLPPTRNKREGLSIQLTAKEVMILQRLAQTDILKNSVENSEPNPYSQEQISVDNDSLGHDDMWELEAAAIDTMAWLSVERVLRHYAQYHFEQPIRSAALIETCFLSSY